MKTPEIIYLEPEECCDPLIGQQWCEDKNPGWYDEDGKSLDGVKYVRADKVDELHKKIKAYRILLFSIAEYHQDDEEFCENLQKDMERMKDNEQKTI